MQWSLCPSPEIKRDFSQRSTATSKVIKWFQIFCLQLFFVWKLCSLFLVFSFKHMNNCGYQVIIGWHEAPIFSALKEATQGVGPFILRKCHGFAQTGSAPLQASSFSSVPNILGTRVDRITWTLEESPYHQSPEAEGRSWTGITWLFLGLAFDWEYKIKETV